MTKFKTSWEIFLRTLRVMKEHKSLLAYPALIASFTLMLGLFFVSPIVLQPPGHRYNEAKH